jgi:hypothetical protein
VRGSASGAGALIESKGQVILDHCVLAAEVADSVAQVCVRGEDAVVAVAVDAGRRDKARQVPSRGSRAPASHGATALPRPALRSPVMQIRGSLRSVAARTTPASIRAFSGGGSFPAP